MKRQKPIKKAAIQKLAEFWDSHDLTDFESELQNVARPVFARKRSIEVNLNVDELQAIQELASAKGITREKLLHQWVRQGILRSANGRRKASTNKSNK
jgi:predicted DNA binding CopG/RHH family protein